MTIEIENESTAMPSPESYVYMFYSGGKIKIGTTDDPVRRLDQLNNAGSMPVQLVWLTFGNRRDEECLHEMFSADRLHGEWFALSDALRDFLTDGVFSLYLKAAEMTWASHKRREALASSDDR